MGKTYFTKLARGTGDKKRIYDVKLRIPAELARKLGMKHGTKVVIRQRGETITVVKAGKKIRKKLEGSPVDKSPQKPA